MSKIKYTLGIVDEEQTELNRLHNFFENDFNVEEINKFKSIDNLVSYIKSEGIDALAIDYRLKEHNTKFNVNGDVIFKDLLSNLKGYPAFILTNDSIKAKKESKSINSFFIIDKEKTHLIKPSEKNEFFREINANIKLYKDSITSKMKRLKVLSNKNNRGKLTDSEENEFLELNNDLSKSLTGTTPIPLKYFSIETNKKFNTLLRKTDKLIHVISKK